MNEKFVTDNKEYIYGKDTDGNIITFKQIQEKILQIALEIDRICRKYDIPYAFGFGSALGINNYGGFIPWDDDIDVVIPYERFDDFVQACKEDIGDEYVFDCYENNKKYNILIPTGKFRLKNTFYKEIYTITLPNKCGSGKTLFVDIVTFMGVPEDPKEHMKLIKYTKRRMPWYVISDAFLRINPYRMKAKIKKLEKETAEKYKDSSMVSQTVIIPWQNWSKTVDKLAFPRDVIYPFKEYDFQGHKIFSFNNVEEFCRLRYGARSLKQYKDGIWIDNFPEKKRKAPHANKINLNHGKK